MKKYFSTKLTIEMLRTNTLTEKHKSNYYLMYSLIAVLVSKGNIDDASQSGFWQFGAVLVIAGILVVGIRELFKINQTIDDKNFIERLFIIGLPVLIQYYLVLLAFLIVVAFSLVVYDEVMSTSYADVVITSVGFNYGTNIIACIFYYFQMSKKFKSLRFALLH